MRFLNTWKFLLLLTFLHGNSLLCNGSNQTQQNEQVSAVTEVFLFVCFCGVFVSLGLMAEETHHKKHEMIGRDQIFCPSEEKRQIICRTKNKLIN